MTIWLIIAALGLALWTAFIISRVARDQELVWSEKITEMERRHLFECRELIRLVEYALPDDIREDIMHRLDNLVNSAAGYSYEADETGTE